MTSSGFTLPRWLGSGKKKRPKSMHDLAAIQDRALPPLPPKPAPRVAPCSGRESPAFQPLPPRTGPILPDAGPDLRAEDILTARHRLRKTQSCAQGLASEASWLQRLNPPDPERGGDTFSPDDVFLDPAPGFLGPLMPVYANEWALPRSLRPSELSLKSFQLSNPSSSQSGSWVFNPPDSYGRIPENYPYDVTVTRRENEGFGFVIISSVSRAGSTIGRIIPGSPAERCGRLHVGDRILAVNHVDINSLHHGEIVNLIKDSGYSVVMTVGPPIDDTSSNASTSHRGYNPNSHQVPPHSGSSAYTPQGGSHPSQPSNSNHPGYPSGPLPPAHMENFHQEDQELNMLELDDQYYAVELQRGARGFGFSIRGGREFHSMPLFVLRIAVDGPAAADGRLRVGDQIIEINGINTKNMTHGEAIELIKSGGSMVRLLVRRGKMPPTALMEQVGLSPLSPTPTVSMSAMGRPISAMSQPSHTMMSNNNYNHFNGGGPNNNYANGYLPQHQQQAQPSVNGMVPTPFTTASAISNGHLNGPMGHSSPRMQFPLNQGGGSSAEQYNSWYHSQQQQQQSQQQPQMYHHHH
eukprot:maker-scaffold490_size156733-snap-gene-0.20 protein:Tk04106 transcript:maker-scaffold490_size156733-snap-gene-0.20-mRNA-1 annotation:"conserved hypothetical protein"